MRRLILAVFAAFVGAVVTLTLVGLFDEPDGEQVRAEAHYTGSQACIDCHRGVHGAYRETLHPRMLGTAAEIDPELLEHWDDLPDPRGNPVVFDEDEPTGLTGRRDLTLGDGAELTDIDGVYVDHRGGERFVARFHDADDQVVHERAVSPYSVGARFRQALAVNLTDGEGTRLLKYQYSFDDGRYQFTWRDRNQARIYEVSCIGCHVSGFDLGGFEADRNQPLEAFTADLGVGCESCHGPGSAHVAAPRTVGLIVDPAELTTDQQVHLCAQCHIRGTSTRHTDRQDAIDFQPGDNILDHLKPVPVRWGEGTDRVAADGKAAASRQQFMDHYLGTKANLPCTTCHVMHERDSHGALLRADITEVCARCHAGDPVEYDTMEAIRHAMDGHRGWDDPAWRGWRSQHTFRTDTEDRVIGLPGAEWPEEDIWPWEDDREWDWDFE